VIAISIFFPDKSMWFLNFGINLSKIKTKKL